VINSICNGQASNSQNGRTLSGYVYVTNVPATGFQLSLVARSAGVTSTYPQTAPVQGVWTLVSATTTAASNAFDQFGIQVTGAITSSSIFFDDFSWK
jgi:hypothetical protein